ncbi:MAG: histidine kinase dimerization/phospho-acceptor domain-containing protein [Nevskia sp.]|nr:histidine kinase dimerization/phospho-acceptor domain-containing protein [Nevskia sp.]
MELAEPARGQLETPEDWRLLRILSYYRLLLVMGLVILCAKGYGPFLFERIERGPFYHATIAYGTTALLLLPLTLYRTLGLTPQALLHFAIDACGISLLVYTTHGLSSGLGVLLLTPAVGCSSVLGARMALLLAAIGTLIVFGEELLRLSQMGLQPSDMSGAGLLGLILFGTTIATSTVAQRARRSEALAARVGSDLASLSQLNQRIIEDMETGVLVVDTDQRIRLLNAAARRLLGTSPRAEGTPLGEQVPELGVAMSAWEQNPGRPIEPISLLGSAAEVAPRFMRLGGGTAAQILVLLDDAGRLREQAQQMNLAALGRLSASIAHEIRNPLAAIDHAGQLLAESPRQDHEERRLLDMIRRHTSRIDKIVRDVLSLSRRDAASPTTIHLRAFLERTVAIYREAHPRQACNVDLDAVAPELTVRFDPNHLQQILLNLWDNSFEHGAGGAGGRDAVRVALSAGRQSPPGQVFLDVADNGGGISSELRDRVFEPFFTTAHKGTGLGLYLARDMCEYNYARLLLLPSERGVRFRILFAA